MNSFRISAMIAGVSLATLLVSAPAYAETMKMMAMLDGGQQNPPITSKANGMADLTYDTDTKKLEWTVEYADLSGAATAAHIHGPAAKGANASVAVPFGEKLKSPIKGSATLTEAQAKDLMDGMMYINIHTAEHKDGEIRGQIEKGM